jgi:hypothetical protein
MWIRYKPFYTLLALNYKILPSATGDEVPQISDRFHLHLTSRILVLRANMGEKRRVREIEETRVDLRLIGEDIKSHRREL